jgi:pimeloyl-ACP methyl ester carboxylesterase
MPTAGVNGIELYYERTGEGPTVLLFNGTMSTLETARPIVDVLAARLDVVVHDQRGLGRTSIPEGPYTMADYAADGLALLDHLGIDTCRVAGISFGGMVAQELAVTAPERVERLALLCTSPGGPDRSSYPLHELGSLSPDERRALSLRLMDTRFDDEWLASHPRDRMMVEAMAGRAAPEPGSEAARGVAEQVAARSHHDVWDRLPAVTAPTLVACGRFDGIAPLANGEAIASRIPGAELRVYEGGHGFFVQDERAFPEVIDFLAG